MTSNYCYWKADFKPGFDNVYIVTRNGEFVREVEITETTILDWLQHKAEDSHISYMAQEEGSYSFHIEVGGEDGEEFWGKNLRDCVTAALLFG